MRPDVPVIDWRQTDPYLRGEDPMVFTRHSDEASGLCFMSVNHWDEKTAIPGFLLDQPRHLNVMRTTGRRVLMCTEDAWAVYRIVGHNGDTFFANLVHSGSHDRHYRYRPIVA